MVVRLAQPGEREAVFNVAEALLKNPPRKDPTVEVNLVSNPDIRTEGRVRYISPQADTTRTYTVRVLLPGAPPQMRLGANVIGSVTLNQGSSISIPGSALFQKDGQPAVWLVEKDGTVQLKPITIDRYQGAAVVVAGGLAQGDVVVTADYGGRVRQKGARTEGAADRDHAAHRAAPEGRDRLLHYVGNLDFRGLSCCRAVRAFENRAEAGASRFRVFEPSSERQKARVFFAFTLRPDGQPGRSFKLAGVLEYSSNRAVRSGSSNQGPVTGNRASCVGVRAAGT